MYKGLPLLALCLIPVGASSDDADVHVIAATLELRGSEARAGRTERRSGRVPIVRGCDYLSHDVEVLNRVPAAAPGISDDGTTAYRDFLSKDDAGRVIAVVLQLSVKSAPTSVPQSFIEVRLTTVTRCGAEASME